MNDIEVDIWIALKGIRDPEYPYTLTQLRVISQKLIRADIASKFICVGFTPTVKHCSMATVIGLCILSKLAETFGYSWKFSVYVTKDSHMDEEAISKQLADKERVSAALENPSLLHLVQVATASSEWA